MLRFVVVVGGEMVVGEGSELLERVHTDLVNGICSIFSLDIILELRLDNAGILVFLFLRNFNANLIISKSQVQICSFSQLCFFHMVLIINLFELLGESCVP